MGRRLRKLRKLRLHHEGVHILILSAIVFGAICAGLYYFLETRIPFIISVIFLSVVYLVMLNFFRCPIRKFESDTTGVVIAPADGKVVVIEEVDENEYFHDRRLQISIFMNLFNVHANWIPVDGRVRLVRHQPGNHHYAWLPKASIENERSTVVIQTPDGQEILVRQIAGALARRVVTYLEENIDYEIDDHMGFIKFGSRVDVFLPLTAKPCVEIDQRTTGNETILARLK